MEIDLFPIIVILMFAWVIASISMLAYCILAYFFLNEFRQMLLIASIVSTAVSYYVMSRFVRLQP